MNSSELIQECFNINIEFGKIHNHIIELTRKLTKEPLIDKLSSELLRLELKKNIATKIRSQKDTTYIIKNGAKSLLFSL